MQLIDGRDYSFIDYTNLAAHLNLLAEIGGEAKNIA